jgi:hypothetical protein
VPSPAHKLINPPAALTRDQRAELTDLLERTDTEDPEDEDLDALRAYFERYPELYDQVGNVARIVRDHIASLITARPVTREAIRRASENMRQSLALPTDSAVEKLLVEHCVTAHVLYFSLLNEYTTSDKMNFTLEEINFWERRLTIAENRFLRTVESLARVRNLAIPVLQVNIAQTQTNIAGGAPPDAEAPTRIVDQPPPSAHTARNASP